MALRKVLVANRGEIAVRILRALGDLGLRGVAIHSEDDAGAVHALRADESLALSGRGAAAYLDAGQIVSRAVEAGCDAVHPGYGFLSESEAFARSCAAAGLVFVGPAAESLAELGDKARARSLAEACGVPILAGTGRGASLDEVRVFLAGLGEGGAMLIKAVSGGGGRGMRRVSAGDDVEAAYTSCCSEAERYFGLGEVYAEEWMPEARHIEVQVAGDGEAVTHFWERECTLQRRHQKVVEVAPSPTLDPAVRERLLEAALGMAGRLDYRGLGTFEFLVDARPEAEGKFAFIEANPRLQVEHTVTEEITGVDLVVLQLELAGGKSLASLGFGASPPSPRGYAVQLRINMEKMAKDGSPRPASGTLAVFEAPSGPGIRVDHHAHAGFKSNPNFDGLLAKVIAHSPSPAYDQALARAYRALCELRAEGIATNIGFLQDLLRHEDVIVNRIHTGFIEAHASEWVGAGVGTHPRLYFEGSPADSSPAREESRQVGAQIASSDPLAVLEHGRAGSASTAPSAAEPSVAPPAESQGPPGSAPVRAPVQGTVVSVEIAEGDRVVSGASLVVMEAMKMEHVIEAPMSGEVSGVGVRVGDTVAEGHALVFLAECEVEAAEVAEEAAVDLDAIRPDLAEVIERHAVTTDARRPEAVARRRKTGQRTARENVEDLCDPDSFIEYAPLVVAAQRRRRELDDLIRNTPADGMVAGVGSVNGELFPDAESRCVLASYDYTVLAGTQGQFNHRKKDRVFELAQKNRLPLVLLTEGGGGRPGDTDASGVAGLDCLAFQFFAELSGWVPLVGINSGRCFAGNAALLGCCDVVIATANSNIGMGGPAMIEGGGLGVFRPEEVGPMEVQVANGVVDIAVEDEEEAVEVAKQYLSYFQGDTADWSCADQRLLRGLIPENRLRIYDVREVISTLADTGSVLELRKGFGFGMVTALARIEGRPVGIVANNPTHLAGAIDREGADKASRFMQLCDAFDIPLLFLCDTPGIMVGPESEKTALVRHAARMFVTAASLTVPFFTVVLRKGYGLGAQAMAGGSFRAPFFTISWPTGEFGGMGLEGAVKLGFRKELEAKTDPEERRVLYEEMVARMYEHGKAVNMASHFEIDGVIDPQETRTWVMRGLRSAPAPPVRTAKKRPCIDTW
ncbi:MAG: carboxyl transferase domain-containing protein [Myxococcota bacterium]|nr:carboxyl transferase domain-containing protein [Myxococcota bacterium]